MNYQIFAKELKNFPAFSLRETQKLNGKVYYQRLIDWQKKGYIKRISNGIFIFADEPIDELFLYYLANKVYEPSYVSLESAFGYYGFIPEAVYRITSVIPKKTSQFQFEDIVFDYRTVHSKFNFGYSLVSWKNVVIKIAEPEKAIIDYFYLNTEIATLNHIEDMRFNSFNLKERIDWRKLGDYLDMYNNKSLVYRLQLLRDWVENA